MKGEFSKKIILLGLAVSMFFTTACSVFTKQEVKEESKVELAVTEEEVSETPLLRTAFAFAKEQPEVQAKAAILVEQSTGTILYEKASTEKMFPASMTKMITAMIVMDYFTAEELVVVGSEINEISWDSSKAGHVVGETLTIKNLIRGLIIPSGNDSANVLALAVARRAEGDSTLNFAAGEKVFTKLMNEKAVELGAKDTHFTNAHGYHDENHYSTAYDMALFAIAFLENSTLMEIANEKTFSGNGADNIFGESEAKTQDYFWRSHNLLITDNEYQYENASGIKTGFTNEAGNCVAAAAKKDGKTLVAIIFNSEDPGRWIDGKNLFEYGFNQYESTRLSFSGELLMDIPLTKHNRLEGDTLNAVYADGLTVYLPLGMKENLVREESYHEELVVEDKEGEIKIKAPLSQGDAIGTVTFSVDGKEVISSSILAGRNVSSSTILNTIQHFFQNFFTNIFTLQGLLILLGIVAVIAILFVGVQIWRGRRSRAPKYSYRKRGTSLRMPKQPRKRRFK